jgi:hypothetical protein
MATPFVPLKRLPPQNKKELYKDIAAIVEHGEYLMPSRKPFEGDGAPGDYIEALLGINAGNKDIPDAVGFEVKFYTPRTSLISLFNKEPRPAGTVAYMVRKFGLTDKQGRKSFRHTIKGRSDRFKVDADESQITVRRLKGNGVVPYWTRDDILSAAGAKLRRLVLVRGVRKGQMVTYNRADCYEDLQLEFFLFEMVNGTIAIDFDAREMKPGSKGMRNHGTSFRVAPNNVCRLYAKKERVC